jgi:uncharacterized cupin superfamily protein
MPHVNLNDLTFERHEERPPAYARGVARLGPRLGARDTGASLYELRPGEAVCPYHYEYGEEEWALVLSGTPTLRTPEGAAELRPMDLAFFPKGPEGAHQLRNDSQEPARVLMLSTVVLPTATAYPDSGKVGVYVQDEREDLIVERASGVDYFKGEA